MVSDVVDGNRCARPHHSSTTPANRNRACRFTGSPKATAASFKDDHFKVGTIEHNGVATICVFNWEESPQTISVALPRAGDITDFWSGARLGRFKGSYTLEALPPRSARLLVLE